MNKKLLISLLLSSTIIVGTTLPTYAQTETNLTVEKHSQIGYRNLDNYYCFELLWRHGYPISDNIIYDCTNMLPTMGGGKMFCYVIYANGIPAPVGHVRINTTSNGYHFVEGTSADEIKKISETNWAEKIKISEHEAIYYARYAVYSKTLKDVRENEVKIQSLSLMNINNELLPCYSLKVNLENSSEQWNVLINAENGETIKIEKDTLN